MRILVTIIVLFFHYILTKKKKKNILGIYTCIMLLPQKYIQENSGKLGGFKKRVVDIENARGVSYSWYACG